MNLLVNFPLEMFGPREEFPFARILSFGPAEGRLEGTTRFGFDLGFDGHAQGFDELMAMLPADFEPDALLFFWPDQEPVPEGLERAPFPVVGLLSDYNLSLPHVTGLWPYFDAMLCDRPGLPVLGRLGFGAVGPIGQYSFRPDVHRVHTDEGGAPLPRDLDLVFAGNLNPVVQRERAPWLDRLRALGDRARVFVGQVPLGEDYGRLLSRARLAFNRSIRGECNLRAFEAPACGALLLMERENLEVRDFFEPDRECVLYGPDDLERKVLWLLAHDAEREAIAAAGHRRVQRHRLAAQWRDLPARIAALDPAARPVADPARLLHGRGRALAGNNRRPESLLRPLLQARRLAPGDAVLAQDLAVVLHGLFPHKGDGSAVVELLVQACERDPRLVPPRLNLLRLYDLAGMQAEARWLRDATLRLLDQPLPLTAFDGLLAPLGYTETSIAWAGAHCEALRTGSIDPLRRLCEELARGGAQGAFNSSTRTQALVR
ncbi:MAG: glycosyltransferase [Planctomycetota bacterium]